MLAIPGTGKNEPSDWIVLEDNHPAIIDRKTFDSAQRRLLARRSRNRSSASSPRPDCYVLTGLVHCEKCGSRMVGHTVKERQYLICSGHLDKGASFCDRNAVRQDELVRHVVTALEERFLDPSMIEQQREDIVAENRRSAQPGKRMKLRRQLGTLDEKLSKAKRRLLEVDADMVNVVQQRIRDLQQDQEQLKRELSQTSVSKQRRVSEANRKLDAALALFSRLRHALVRSDFKTLRDCLEKTIDKIVVKVSKTKQGRRHRYHLLGGEIHPQVSSLYCSPRWTHM
jgi:site-specific DNA recombinase